MKRIVARTEDEMLQRHGLEKKRLPKVLKADMKTRMQMFRQSMRIGNPGDMADEKERVKQVFKYNHKKLPG